MDDRNLDEKNFIRDNITTLYTYNVQFFLQGLVDKVRVTFSVGDTRYAG